MESRCPMCYYTVTLVRFLQYVNARASDLKIHSNKFVIQRQKMLQNTLFDDGTWILLTAYMYLPHKLHNTCLRINRTLIIMHNVQCCDGRNFRLFTLVPYIHVARLFIVTLLLKN